MTISWHGFNYFKVQNSQHTVIFNPYSLDTSTKVGKAKADVILFSDPTKVDASRVDSEGMIIDSPGEYETKDIFVYGSQKNGNILFLVIFEEIRIAFLGDFGHQELTEDDLELIEGADIVILPVGGGQLLNAEEAGQLISRIEPRVVIPSCFAGGCGKLKVDPVTTFVKEFGVKPEETDKYKIQKKNLPQEDVKLIVLKPYL